MSQGFDPYHRWLGISPRDQPPHHYRLLGIPWFEEDPEVIETASARQTSYVRTMMSGEHEALARRVLEEIDAARVCLLQPEEKAAYDALLRARFASAASPAEAAEPSINLFDDSSVDLFDDSSVDLFDDSSTAGGMRSSGPPPLPWRRRRRPNRALPFVMLVLAVGGVAGLAVWLRQNADREPAPARIELDWPEDQRRGATLSINGEPQIIPQTGPVQYTCLPGEVRIAARVPGFEPLERVKALSPGGVWRLHAQWRRATRPADPISALDEDDVDALWEEFLAGDEAPPGVAALPKPKAAVKVPPVGPMAIPPEKPSAASAETARRLPVPSESEQSDLVRQIDEAYPPADARTASEKLQRVEQWRDLAQKSKNRVERFVLLRSAAELALEAGGVEAMLHAIDLLVEDYAVDGATLREKMLARAADGAKDSRSIESWMAAVEPLIEQAMQDRRYDAAVRLADLAVRLGQSSAGARFRREAAGRAKECREFADAFRRREQALATLARDPRNATAHLAVGVWRCFFVDEAAEGWPHLAQGDDASLRAIGQRELDKPATIDDQLKLGDDWAALAKQRHGPMRRGQLARAAAWYASAWRRSSGLAQRKVATRIADLAAAVDDDRAVPAAVVDAVRLVAGADVLSAAERDALSKRTAPWGLEGNVVPGDARSGGARIDRRADRLLGEAWDSIEKGDVARGREKLVQARREFRNDVRPGFSLGLLDALVGRDWASAEACFVQCAKLDPYNVAVLNNRALARLRKSHESMALREWEAMAAAGPASAEMIHNVGRYRHLLAGGQIREKPLLVRAVDDLFGRISGPSGRGFDAGRGFRWMRLPLADGRSVGFADDSGMDDRWCFVCAGAGKVRCPQADCVRGAVRKSETRTIGRNPTPGADIRSPVVSKKACPTCSGAGMVVCKSCSGNGIDRRLRAGPSSGKP